MSEQTEKQDKGIIGFTIDDFKKSEKCDADLGSEHGEIIGSVTVPGKIECTAILSKAAGFDFSIPKVGDVITLTKKDGSARRDCIITKSKRLNGDSCKIWGFLKT